jgi:hypothetical protein
MKNLKCPHRSLVPYEQVAGKRAFSQKPFREYIDWTSNIINSHYLRVTKYYCPACESIIPAPSDAKDE